MSDGGWYLFRSFERIGPFESKEAAEEWACKNDAADDNHSVWRRLHWTGAMRTVSPENV